MGRRLILETSFLIDLERELLRGVAGAAHRFLEQAPDSQLFITQVIAAELACGPRGQRREDWQSFVAPFRILQPTSDVCWAYAEAYRFLKTNGLLIGTNDLWIAATGVAHSLPIVTSNERHFRRVPGLEVISYSANS